MTNSVRIFENQYYNYQTWIIGFAPIQLKGVEFISTLEILTETLKNLDFIKETSPNYDQNWLESPFHLTIRLRLEELEIKMQN